VAADIFETLTATDVAILAGNVAVLGAIVRKTWPVLRRLRDLLDDWNGESARPGVPARAGVMVRLQSIEERTVQLEHNGGRSLRDDITALREHAAAQADLTSIREELSHHLTQAAEDRAELWRVLALPHLTSAQPPDREDHRDGA
jgi:hypothetical protein